MPISQARILRPWTHDTLDTRVGGRQVFSHPVQEPVAPVDTLAAAVSFQSQPERQNEHSGSHEPQLETTAAFQVLSPESAKQEELEQPRVRARLKTFLRVFPAESLRGAHSHHEDSRHGGRCSKPPAWPGKP